MGCDVGKQATESIKHKRELFTVTSWARHLKLDFSSFPILMAFQERVAARPAVQAALVAEGLIEPGAKA